MFVSSYSTYISTNTQDKTLRERSSNTKETPSFKSALYEPQELIQNKSLSLPIDYVSNNKSFGNKLELQRQEQELQQSSNSELDKSKELTKEFANNKSMRSAAVAYKEGSNMFALVRKTHFTIDQTPTIDKNLSNELQEVKEKNLRHTMVNTYLSNDNYYKITA